MAIFAYDELLDFKAFGSYSFPFSDSRENWMWE